jgi:hypothetical protein
MSKYNCKVNQINSTAGPFNIFDESVQYYCWKCFKKHYLKEYIVNDSVIMVTLTSIGKCKISSKSISVTTITKQGMQTNIQVIATCLWKH